MIAALPTVRHPELDTVFWQTVAKGARSVCVTAANPGEGVSTLALDLARRGAAGGLRTVLIDANLPRATLTATLGLPKASWNPASRSICKAIACEGIELAMLPAPAGAEAVSFRDPAKLRRMLEDDLAAYELVVVDASPVNSLNGNAIPAEVIASACAVTVLVVLTGVTSQPALRIAVERLTMADAIVCGAVFNDLFTTSLTDEICRQVDRLGRITPRLASWLRRRIRASSLLDLRV